MTSVALTAIRCARSATVIVSGIWTSRTTGAVGRSNPCCVSTLTCTGRRLTFFLRRRAAAPSATCKRMVGLARPTTALRRRLWAFRLRGAWRWRHRRRRRCCGTAGRAAASRAALAWRSVSSAASRFASSSAASRCCSASRASISRCLLLLGSAALLLELALGGEPLLVLGTTLCVELFLLLARLLLEHVALDVGSLAANLDIDGPRSPLPAREPQLTLRLALQRDAARRSGTALGTAVRARKCVSSSSFASSLIMSLAPATLMPASSS